MKERFENSPLVEIIAELRWEVQGHHAQPGFPGPLSPQSIQPYEEASVNFSRAVADFGFRSSERLIPQGFPWMIHNPAIRYRFSDGNSQSRDTKNSSLFQIGPGIFTANAVPPYSSWDDFCPIVSQGVEAMLSAQFPHAGEPKKFAPTLRYIDAFKEPLSEGRPLKEFLSEVMGFTIELPDTLRRLDGNDNILVPLVHIIKPLSFGKMALQFMDGAVNGEKALILDMSVSFNEAVSSHCEIVGSFSMARDVIHKAFVDMTTPIHGLMKPIGDA